MEGPGRTTSGRPTLQTSSNQRNSNRLARTPVTNVVNLSPKTAIFSEKAIGLTTFVTTTQKSTQKTPRIDDVCNNTHQSTPKSQHDKPDHIGGPENPAAAAAGGGGARPGFNPTHRATHQRPGTTGVEGAGGSGGPGRGAGGWRQGQGGPRDRPLRAQLACGDLAGGPPPTGTHSGRAPKQHNGAPGTSAEPQAPPGPGQTALTLRRRRAPGVPCS